MKREINPILASVEEGIDKTVATTWANPSHVIASCIRQMLREKLSETSFHIEQTPEAMAALMEFARMVGVEFEPIYKEERKAV